MDKSEKIKERQKHNAPFLAVFEYTKNKLKLTQGQLALKMGITPSLISYYKAGTKKVSEETMDALCRVSKGKLNKKYMLGISKYMLLENVPDDEMLDEMEKEYNPDYEVMQRAKDSVNHVSQGIDQSSTINAAISAYNDAILSLKRESSAKDDTINELRLRLSEKDDLIASLKQQISDLNTKLSRYESEEINGYHFPIGAADNPIKRPK